LLKSKRTRAVNWKMVRKCRKLRRSKVWSRFDCVNSMGLESPSRGIRRPIRGINSLSCICLYRETGKASAQFPSNEQNNFPTVQSDTHCWSTLPASWGNLACRFHQRYGRRIPSIRLQDDQHRPQHRCVFHRTYEVCGHRRPQTFFGHPLTGMRRSTGTREG
jgi:hypothetical protein